MKTAKSMTDMGFKPIKQVELTNYLLNNLQHFNLKPTTKLVLLYLSGCYNPKHADVFPKQKTIADKMGISEASVIRAIAELHKEGLIISERKFTNRYKFTGKLLVNLNQNVFFEPDKMQDLNSQKEIKQTCKKPAIIHEQRKEQLKEQEKKDDFYLVKYAKEKQAKNIKAYVAAIKKSGNADEIINHYKKIEQKKKILNELTDELIKQKETAQLTAAAPPKSWYTLKEKLLNAKKPK